MRTTFTDNIISLPRMIVILLLAFLGSSARCSAQSEPAAETEKQLAATSIDFDTQLAPILVSRCLECHGDADPQGGMSFVDTHLAMKGGESGTAIVPGDAANSLLWQRIDADEMPPENPLSDSEKAIVQRWIDQGAQWGTSRLDPLAASTATRGGRDWWSLQPLRNVSPPQLEPTTVGRNAIDWFVWQRLQAAGLQPANEADPRTLIRRLYFDLIGLPPSPEQVATFIADPSDEAYSEMVDNLLSSQHYGERWGRHWLDVVRFGESDGFERNNPRENAWPYRDWVISALNADMPYNEFVRMQLIGDQLDDQFNGAAASGFWVAGVHNTVVGGSTRMKQLARQDEIEEVLATVGQTFVGLTINCARCHDHKFDPITQKEYYQLASAISGLDQGERVEQVPEEIAKLAVIEDLLIELQSELSAIDESPRRTIREARAGGQVAVPEAPAALARWEFDNDYQDSLGDLHGHPNGNARIENGALILDGQSFVETTRIPTAIAEKTLEAWVELEDLDQTGGAAISLESGDGEVFDAIVFAEREPKQWMAGSNGFVRTDSFEGSPEADATRRPVQIVFVYHHDGTVSGYRDGIAYGRPIHKSALQTFPAGEAEVLFGLRHRPPGDNRFLKAKIHRAALYDRALSPAEITASRDNAATYVSEEEIVQWLDTTQRERRSELKSRIAATSAARLTGIANANRSFYTLTSRAGSITNVLLRGDPDNLGDVVNPAALAAVKGLSGDFDLPPDAPEAARRRKLTNWITHPSNPLFARVIVNRIWHYHFGIGIVETPNDLGFNGGRPSHPELLDYLASQLLRQDYQLKSLHRLIVSSSTYRQSSRGLNRVGQPLAEAKDTNNRWLWRSNRRRLDAESLRDAMLEVAGKLDGTIGGPSFKDVSVTLNNGTTYYEPIDVDGEPFWRRTVYRFNPRGGRSALLDTFDCPDSASTAPRRSVTTTPLQSLSLMNNAFVLRMSDYFADRVKSEVGENETKQIVRAWQLAVARDPDENEQRLSQQLVSQHGLSALCRGLFNFNEFVMIE